MLTVLATLRGRLSSTPHRIHRAADSEGGAEHAGQRMWTAGDRHGVHMALVWRDHPPQSTRRAYAKHALSLAFGLTLAQLNGDISTAASAPLGPDNCPSFSVSSLQRRRRLLNESTDRGSGADTLRQTGRPRGSGLSFSAPVWIEVVVARNRRQHFLFSCPSQLSRLHPPSPTRISVSGRRQWHNMPILAPRRLGRTAPAFHSCRPTTSETHRGPFMWCDAAHALGTD